MANLPIAGATVRLDLRPSASACEAAPALAGPASGCQHLPAAGGATAEELASRIGAVPDGELALQLGRLASALGSPALSILDPAALEPVLRPCLERLCALPRGPQGGHHASAMGPQGRSSLHAAAGLGLGWAVPMLAAAGVGVGGCDELGATPLHWAAARGQVAAVAALLAAGAAADAPAAACSDRKALGAEGLTPAAVAAAAGHDGIAAYLDEAALARSLTLLQLEEGGRKPPAGSPRAAALAGTEGAAAVGQLSDSGCGTTSASE